MDLISVIVPVYKVEAYLDRCVQSIVDQTYTNLEIILVDDGSPDRCPEMCDEWAKKDSRIRVIHKKNGGQSDARNVGMDNAQGSYICFVDSDDWIAPEFVEYLYTGIRQHSADVCACDYRLTYPSDVTSFKSESFSSQAHTPEDALSTLITGTVFYAVVWNKLYTADILKGERFLLGKCIDDEFFTYRILAKAKQTAYIPAKLYNYFQREGSIMSSFKIGHLEALDAYLERIALFKEKFPRLYERDSATFSIACASFCIASMQVPEPEQSKMIQIIKNRRKQMKYPFALLKKQPLRNLVYIFGTRFALKPFCRILLKNRKD